MGALGSQQLWEEELLDTAAGKEDKEQLVAREMGLNLNFSTFFVQ